MKKPEHDTDRPLPEELPEKLTIALLRHMPQPVIPEELRAPEFLERIYASAADAEVRSLAPVLEAGLRRITAPGDASWHDPVSERSEREDEPSGDELADIRHQVEAVLPGAPGRVPGMLWTRIRADIRSQRERTRAKVPSGGRSGDLNHFFAIRWMRRTAAVLLLGAGLFGLARILPQAEAFFPPNGTQGEITFVEHTSPSGIDDTFLGGGR